LSGLGIEASASAKEPLGGGLAALLKPVDCQGLWTVLSGAQAGRALLMA
jgi:hypothetical protein